MKSLHPTLRIPSSLFFLLIVFLSVACSDDKARDSATEQALNTESKTSDPVVAVSPPVSHATVGSLNLAATRVDAKNGGEACVAVTAREFQEIVSMQYTMKWDPAVLRFKEVKGFGLPGMAANNFGSQLAGKGLLTYSWFDINVKGITQPDGFKLYEVCFDVIGKPGSSSFVQFVNEPTVIELTNSASNFLNLKSEEGQVKVR